MYHDTARVHPVGVWFHHGSDSQSRNTFLPFRRNKPERELRVVQVRPNPENSNTFDETRKNTLPAPMLTRC